MSHSGISKLHSYLRKISYGIPKKMVEDFCKSCEACLSNEPLKARDDMEHVVASYPFERLQMDLVDVSRYHSV